MIPDIINGSFEFLGAVMLTFSVMQLYKDKVVRGVRVFPTAFFTLWGLWNLFYYPHLNQWYSFAGGLAIVIVNAMWVAMAVHYGRRS